MILPPPRETLRASVVVPARDEEDLIEACLDALAAQQGVTADEYEVLLVLDGCEDETEARARRFASEHPALALHLLHGPGRGAGRARRVGMDEACSRLVSVGRPGGLVASTDADTVVAPDWLRAQLDAAARGARAIGGRIELRDDEDLVQGVREWRAARGREKQMELLAEDTGGGTAEHWQFSGASLALTAEVYAEVGGLEPRAALEDEQLERALERCGIPIERSLAVRVMTSARTVGRAKRGLARDLALASWVRSNTFDRGDFDPAMLAERKAASGATVSVILPMGGKGRGTSALLDALAPLTEAGLIDEEIVLCREAKDLSSRGDARFYPDADLLPGHGPVRGYGDALWRGLAVSGGEILLFLDPAAPDPDGRRALGLVGPLLLREELHLVKGFSPVGSGGDEIGARGLSELVARPLINLYRPELAGFVDPVSAEFSARRSLLASLPFPVGYGASLSLLLDAHEWKGVDALAQVCLGERPEARVPTPDLGEAAYATLTAAMSRTGEDDLGEHAPGPLFLPLPGHPTSLGQRRVAVEERPPLASLGPPRSGR
ncbi:glycosyltransferase [Rubrobacter marinus]|uniref:Glycosyltransferase n=1 Tax=Rubrobacter marinus TaxID=2653852 RepID=A0A6G8PXP8_9ACTN|nr:glycosyltransferase family 2 protein [Rubrobacter marinus]QIN78991.1 glycosyltransferase [Rubrobacter marinus]